MTNLGIAELSDGRPRVGKKGKEKEREGRSKSSDCSAVMALVLLPRVMTVLRKRSM